MRAPLICQHRLPVMPWMVEGGLRLPGLSPVPLEKWLLQDDAFAAQMAYRDALIETKQSDVYQCLPDAEAGAQELLETLVAELPVHQTGYHTQQQTMKRPDRVIVPLDNDAPLLTAGRLAQQDFALIQKIENTHHLMGGLICFPANWQLADKIGRSIASLHEPVNTFDQEMARRTERIFNGLRPDTPLQRANVLIYTNPDLHQPAPDGQPKIVAPDQPRYVRVERQTLRRLPHTRTIVFAIHTCLVAANTLPDKAFEKLAKVRPQLVSH